MSEGEEMANLNGHSLFERLVRTVVKLFFKEKEMLLIDVVIEEEAVTERTLRERLNWEPKTVRDTVAGLKEHRILSVKSVADEESVVKSNYYFVDYENLVNVVKYKLCEMQSRLHSLERDLSRKPSFRCEPCARTWTDLEAAELFDTNTLAFKCFICSQPVTEDTSQVPGDTYNLAAKFNEQLAPLYEIIQSIDLGEAALP